ncbi:MAG: sulfurtransferase [Betaproteobacteria bacterium]
MSYTTIISADQLNPHLNDANWVIFDCRHDLMKPDAGAQAYAQSHVPGARFAHTDHDLAAPKNGRNGRHPLPEPERFTEWLGRNGVDASKQVICYDSAAGSSATRLWWMLRWLGHDAVAVLDGGWEAWLRESLPVTAELPNIKPATFTARPREAMVDANYVREHLNQSEMVLVDARSAERFRGETEPVDPVAGHIPGARNRLYKDNLGPDGRFKSPGVLKREFEILLQTASPSRVVHQCGSGISACHNVLAMEIAELPGSRLYPGSWSEWIADSSRPIATGP